MTLNIIMLALLETLYSTSYFLAYCGEQSISLWIYDQSDIALTLILYGGFPLSAFDLITSHLKIIFLAYIYQYAWY